MESVINNSFSAKKTPRAMATMVYLQSYMMFSISEERTGREKALGRCHVGGGLLLRLGVGVGILG